MENTQERPVGKDGKLMKKFEVRRRFMPNGTWNRAIFIDGEKFDWSVDQQSLIQAAQMGHEYLKAARTDIQKHFLECLSEFLHRNVTAEEFAQTQKTGWV